MPDEISRMIATVEAEYREDIAKALQEVGHPIERRLIAVATPEQFVAMETVAADMKARIQGASYE